MFYKEYKLLATHYVLKILKKQTERVTTDEKPNPLQNYKWVDVYFINNQLSILFGKEVINDAARMMFVEFKHQDNEVDMLNNSNDIYKTQFKINNKGIASFNEDKYLRMFLKSWKTIIAICGGFLLGTVALITGLREIGILK